MSTVYTSFITVNGHIRAEVNASPLASQLYLPDALGTVTQTVDTTTSSNLIYRARHRAYGDRAVAVATGVPPQSQFVGAFGVRRTGRSHAHTHMRARVHSVTEGRFISQAPLWGFLAGENRYGYANANPARYVNPSGNNWQNCSQNFAARAAWSGLKAFMKPICGSKLGAIQNCWRRCGEHDWQKEGESFCKHITGDPGYGVDFDCSFNEKFCKSGLLGLRGAAMGTIRGSWHENCNVHICPGNAPADLRSRWRTRFSAIWLGKEIVIC